MKPSPNRGPDGPPSAKEYYLLRANLSPYVVSVKNGSSNCRYHREGAAPAGQWPGTDRFRECRIPGGTRSHGIDHDQ